MDALRGVAVLLVILTHTGTMPRGLDAEFTSPTLLAVTGAFHTLRMPLLVFLSGVLLPRSLSKPLGVYARGKLERILWPFLVWMVILALALGSPESIVSAEYWRGGAWHLWFLWVLLFCYLVGPLARIVPPVLLAVGLFALLLGEAGGPRDLLRPLYWGVYFFLGAAAGRHLHRIRAAPGALALLALVLALLAALAHTTGALVVSERRPWSVFPALSGILFMLWLGPRLPRMRLLEFCGRRSIVLFVTHMPVLIVTVGLFRGLAPEHPLAFYALTAGPTFLIPLALARVYPRVAWLYVSPTADRPLPRPSWGPLRRTRESVRESARAVARAPALRAAATAQARAGGPVTEPRRSGPKHTAPAGVVPETSAPPAPRPRPRRAV